MVSKLKSHVPRRVLNLYHYLRAVIAVVWYGYPARSLQVIGVTGTDGKTSTTHMLYAIFKAAGIPASLISTTGAVIHGRDNVPLALHVTTPNPFDLQNFLREARRAGSKVILLEATSHGLAQHRVLGCNFKIGVVTNITPEHLDYHGSYDQLLRDKARLFRGVEVSILNLDDRSFKPLRKLAHGRVIKYGLGGGADVRAEAIEYGPPGTSFTIPHLGIRINSRFVGDFNIQNMLAAAAAAEAFGIEPKQIATGLENAAQPPGRLQQVDLGQPFSVFIDFAHTPNSLEKVLQLLRKITKNHLIVVFGCAGERDPHKRFPMGASAGRYCDATVITAEDPRTENLETIIAEIAAGVESEGGSDGKTYFRIPDRAEAIAFAIQNLASPGDVVVVTGKAHEKSMCFGRTEYPWDEFEMVAGALEGLQSGETAPPTSQLPTSKTAAQGYPAKGGF